MRLQRTVDAVCIHCDQENAKITKLEKDLSELKAKLKEEIKRRKTAETALANVSTSYEKKVYSASRVVVPETGRKLKLREIHCVSGGCRETQRRLLINEHIYK